MRHSTACLLVAFALCYVHRSTAADEEAALRAQLLTPNSLLNASAAASAGKSAVATLKNDSFRSDSRQKSPESHSDEGDGVLPAQQVQQPVPLHPQPVEELKSDGTTGKSPLDYEKAGEDVVHLVKDGREFADNTLGFWHGFVASFSVIIVSEIGDKTWFIAAILAMRHSRLTVFVGALAALTIMTILSAFLGWATQIIPRTVTFYVSTALFALFGLKMLKEGYDMSPDEGQEEYAEAENEVKKKEEDKRLMDSEQWIKRYQVIFHGFMKEMKIPRKNLRSVIETVMEGRLADKNSVEIASIVRCNQMGASIKVQFHDPHMASNVLKAPMKFGYTYKDKHITVAMDEMEEQQQERRYGTKLCYWYNNGQDTMTARWRRDPESGLGKIMLKRCGNRGKTTPAWWKWLNDFEDEQKLAIDYGKQVEVGVVPPLPGNVHVAQQNVTAVGNQVQLSSTSSTATLMQPATQYHVQAPPHPAASGVNSQPMGVPAVAAQHLQQQPQADAVLPLSEACVLPAARGTVRHRASFSSPSSHPNFTTPTNKASLMSKSSSDKLVAAQTNNLFRSDDPCEVEPVPSDKKVSNDFTAVCRALRF